MQKKNLQGRRYHVFEITISGGGGKDTKQKNRPIRWLFLQKSKLVFSTWISRKHWEKTRGKFQRLMLNKTLSKEKKTLARRNKRLFKSQLQSWWMAKYLRWLGFKSINPKGIVIFIHAFCLCHNHFGHWLNDHHALHKAC